MYKGDLFEVRLYMVRCSQILPRFFHHNGLIGFPKLGNELHRCMGGAWEVPSCTRLSFLIQLQNRSPENYNLTNITRNIVVWKTKETKTEDSLPKMAFMGGNVENNQRQQSNDDCAQHHHNHKARLADHIYISIS